MKKIRKTHKKCKLAYIKTMLFIMFLCLLFMRGYIPFESTGENVFHVTLNGQDVGTVSDRALAEELMIQARKNVASKSSEMVFMETELEVVGEELLYGEVDDKKEVLARMETVLTSAIQKSLLRSYTVKINEYTINLATVEECRALLQAAIDKYDTEGKFRVALVQDAQREFNVLTTEIVESSRMEESDASDGATAGIQGFFDGLDGQVEEAEKVTFEDYELGLNSIGFYEEVEVVEVYLPESQLTELGEAIELVTKEQEAPSIYEVVAGDTLYEIAITVNLPIDTIVAMNDFLKDENTTLHIGDQLTITVPTPELSVTRVEDNYYEEIYDADVIYIDNNNWYTNKVVVHQQPSAGFRKIIAEVTYVNDKEVSRTILKEEVVMEAVPKIVERGTVTPPTYIKPLTGGRASSGFGPRKAPTKGASTYHKAQDWATPVGTSIVASCGGTVAKAGWGSGYGYVVYIDHPDGRQTRYAHLSKILVKVGQKVKQGEKIALSGNTGITSGPHLHFELLINGKQVDPMKYINK